MSGHDKHDDHQTRDRFDTSVGGTGTPTTGSESGTGEKDPVMSGAARDKGQGADEDELSGSNPDAPGYGRPA